MKAKLREKRTSVWFKEQHENWDAQVKGKLKTLGVYYDKIKKGEYSNFTLWDRNQKGYGFYFKEHLVATLIGRTLRIFANEDFYDELTKEQP